MCQLILQSDVILLHYGNMLSSQLILLLHYGNMLSYVNLLQSDIILLCYGNMLPCVN